MVVPHLISDSQRVLIVHPCASTFHKGLTSFKGLANKKDLDYCFYAWFSRCFICSSQRPNIFLKGGAVREGHRTDLYLGRCMNIFFRCMILMIVNLVISDYRYSKWVCLDQSLFGSCTRMLETSTFGFAAPRLKEERTGLAFVAENNTNKQQKEFSYSTKRSYIAVMRIQLLLQAW